MHFRFVITVIFLFFFTGNLHCQGIDSLKKAEWYDDENFRIDVDLPYSSDLFFSIGLTYKIYKKHYLGARIGLKGMGIAIKNYPDNSTNIFNEGVKFDLIYKYVFNKNIEVENGFKYCEISYVPQEFDYGNSAGIGIFSQPMIGWKHFKFGTQIYMAINKSFIPVYFYPLCFRISI